MRAFVAGHPIGHSRSPLIHGTWLERHRIAGSYTAVDVAPEDFADLLDAVRTGYWAGGNVTIPHKEAAFAGVDRRNEAAEAIGAVNTIWVEDGKLIGANTDAYGFAANLDDGLKGWRDGDFALVLGAGGAGRAVIYALQEAGYRRIAIVNRTVSRASSLAGLFGDIASAHGWEEAETLLRDADLVVNTTSLGMKGQPELRIDLHRARPDTLATDIVYVPLQTPFLAGAAQAGLKTCDGLGMLLHQAAPGFEHWFGKLPEVDDELYRIVVADLQEESG